jgi:hypothetical protein
MKDIKQMVLSNGEEIIAEVVEWPEQPTGSAVLRNPISIVVQEDYDEGTRMFNVRPFMSFQQTNNPICTLNLQHVITMAIPSAVIGNHYTSFIAAMKAEQEAAIEEDDDDDFTPDDNVIKFDIKKLH